MDMKSVDSSLMEEIGYDYESSELWIRFKTGKCYIYAGVPEELWEEMMGAESMGKFFHSQIKNNYETILHNPEL